MKPFFICDSGAFSVWSQGKTLDIDKYLRFALEHPQADAYICMDVIPPSMGSGIIPPDEIKWSASETLKNYQKMISTLGEDKVIAVYHQSAPVEYLEKYLDMRVPYLAIGAIAMMGPKRIGKLREIVPYVTDSEGKPRTKLHGLGLTSLEVMSAIPWYSVDSSSWVRSAAMGSIFIPKYRDGDFRYDIDPWHLYTSPKSPFKDVRQAHFDTLTPTVKKQVQEYFDGLGLTMGEFSVVPVEGKYKLKDDELWYEKPTSVMKIHKKGLVTCHHHRFFANARFVRRVNQALPIEHICFAGGVGTVDDRIERNLGRRMFTYFDFVSRATKKYKVYQQWCAMKG